MKQIEVEAVEDRSRAEGGHAVILLRGVDRMAGAFRFRLRPVEQDAVGPDAAALAEEDLAPLVIDVRPEGLALTVGPDITERPSLVPGTVLEITLPDADVRGELLWPAVTPQARPKRRNIMTRRSPSDPLPRPVGAAPTGLAADIVAEPTPALQPEADRPAATEPVASSPVAEASDVPPAAAPLRRTLVVPAARPLHEPIGRSPLTQDDAVPAAGEAAEAKAATATNDIAVAPPASAPRMAVDEPTPEADVAPAPAMPATGRRGISASSAAALAVAVMIGGQIMALRALDLGVVRRSAPTVAEVPAPVAAAPASAPESSPAGDQPSVYDILAAGTRSPRGVAAEGVSPAKAVQLAHALMHGPEAERDPDEAIYWLKRYVLGTSGTEHSRIALTQLGSAYAQPARGRRDFVSARLAWELAAALGDPVAMCFLGAMQEHGLGVAADKQRAGTWYERAAAAGRNCASGTSGTSGLGPQSR